MSKVEDVYKNQRYEDEMTIARRVSKRVTHGQLPTDPRLLEMLHQNAGAHGIVIPRGHEGIAADNDNQVQQDLKRLGFDFGQFEIPEIEVIKREIELLRHSIAKLVKSTKVMLPTSYFLSFFGNGEGLLKRKRIQSSQKGQCSA